MANGKNTKQTTSTTTAAPATTPAQATPAPAQAEKKAPSKKVEKKEEVAAAPAPATTTKKVEAVAPVAPVVAPVAPVTEEAVDEKKARRTVSKQSVYDDFVALMAKIQEEIDKRAPTAESPATATTDGTAAASKKKQRKRDTGVPLKFLRSINKRLAVLQSDATKMMKLKTKTTRNNENSGLMKPVNISEPLFNFLKSTGFDIVKDQKYPRVEITKNIHQYVSKNNLRDPKDKRTITPDAKLAALLNYDAATAKDKMTYFRLPQYLKTHFISEPKA